MAENMLGFPDDEWQRLEEISGPDVVGRLIIEDPDEFEATAPANGWNEAQKMLSWLIKHRAPVNG